jgi:hypothetical protein
MPEMTESQRRWEAWFDAFTKIRDAWPGPADVPCPEGDGGELHISYTGDPADRIGYAILWCDVSRNGIFVHRVGIPEGADMLPFDATIEQQRAVMPEVHLIPDDPYTPDGADDPDDLIP